MRNIERLVHKADIHDYVRSLWRTDLFRSSHGGGGFVHALVDRFARLPRFFFDMTDARLERAHFSIWWGGVSHRTYDKASCNDLYLLHEIAHGADMIHVSGQPFDCFARKTLDNELFASVTTEIMVYFALPELRAMTFEEEIYADRFLRNILCLKKWREDPQALTAELYYRRRQAMFRPHPKDGCEMWLARFPPQNEKWLSIWKHWYDAIESRMEAFAGESLSGQRHEALQRHLDWLLSKEVSGDGDIPFLDEARAFAGVHYMCRKGTAVPKAS